jgi:hypothetical protein
MSHILQSIPIDANNVLRPAIQQIPQQHCQIPIQRTVGEAFTHVQSASGLRAITDGHNSSVDLTQYHSMSSQLMNPSSNSSLAGMFAGAVFNGEMHFHM